MNPTLAGLLEYHFASSGKGPKVAGAKYAEIRNYKTDNGIVSIPSDVEKLLKVSLTFGYCGWVIYLVRNF